MSTTYHESAIATADPLVWLLSHTPVPGEELVFDGELRQISGTHYTLSGSTLTFVVPPAHTPEVYYPAAYLTPGLLTATDIKALLGQFGAADDGVFAILAGAVSDYAKNRTGQDWTTQTITERIDGTGKDFVYLSQGPADSVTSLSDGGVSVDASRYVIYPHKIKLLNGAVFSTDPQGVAVTYSVTASGIDDVLMACKLIAIHWFHRRKTMGKAVESLTTGGSISIDKADVPPEAEELLSKRVKTWGYF